MSEYYTIVTETGTSILTSAYANNESVKLKYMAFGDGGGADIAPTPEETTLVNETYRTLLGRLTVDPNNANQLIAEASIPPTIGGFTIREIGLFDENGNMMAVGNFASTYKPIIADGTASDLIVRMYMQTSYASTVNIFLDTSLVMATQQYVIDACDDHHAETDPHPQYATDDDLDNHNISPTAHDDLRTIVTNKSDVGHTHENLKSNIYLFANTDEQKLKATLGRLPTFGSGHYALLQSSTMWTVPQGVTKIRVRVLGAGGSGAIIQTPSLALACGAGGGYAHGIFDVIPGTQYAVTVGLGGSRSLTGVADISGNLSFATLAGATGGTSSFGTLISATGGSGASGSPVAGSGYGGDFQASGNIKGGAGSQYGTSLGAGLGRILSNSIGNGYEYYLYEYGGDYMGNTMDTLWVVGGTLLHQYSTVPEVSKRFPFDYFTGGNGYAPALLAPGSGDPASNVYAHGSTSTAIGQQGGIGARGGNIIGVVNNASAAGSGGVGGGGGSLIMYTYGSAPYLTAGASYSYQAGSGGNGFVFIEW